MEIIFFAEYEKYAWRMHKKELKDINISLR